MKVLLLDAWTDAAKSALSEVGHIMESPLGACGLLPPYRGDIEGIVAGLGVKYLPSFTGDYLRQFPNLRFIATCTTGLDHIDTAYARSRGIEIISLQGDPFLRDVWATAEHTMALILALARRIPQAHADVLGGAWNRERWQGVELRGKTLGIVGLGRVGNQVRELAHGFGMGVAYAGLGVLPISDVVSVHVDLNPSTRCLCDYQFFGKMKRGALFVNTSRGAVVCEDALLSSLADGQIAGAALDVVDGEPSPSPALLDYARTHDNLILTPHIGGNTRESREKTQLHIARKIARFVEERAPCTSAR